MAVRASLDLNLYKLMDEVLDRTRIRMTKSDIESFINRKVKNNLKLNYFRQAGWYGQTSFRSNSPIDAMNSNILRLIYNGAKTGDDYCLDLIKNLYKVYHKKEYNQLKRFSTINPDEIFSLTDDEYTDSEYPSIGRIMGMCPFMGIRLHENCSFMYKLSKKRAEFLEEENENRN